MDRLTKRVKTIADTDGIEVSGSVSIGHLIIRLAAYEDSGLTSDEIADIQRHREGNQTCYVSEMCELERVRAAKSIAAAENLVLISKLGEQAKQLAAMMAERDMWYKLATAAMIDTEGLNNALWCELWEKAGRPDLDMSVFMPTFEHEGKRYAVKTPKGWRGPEPKGGSVHEQNIPGEVGT